MQTSGQERQKLTTLRSHFTTAANPRKQSPMPSESEPVYVEPVPEAPAVRPGSLALQETFFRVSRFRHKLGIQNTKKINDVSCDQLVSDLSTFVK